MAQSGNFFSCKYPAFVFKSGDASGDPGTQLMGDVFLKTFVADVQILMDNKDKRSSFFQEELNLPRV